jgi:hypothetical protein
MPSVFHAIWGHWGVEIMCEMMDDGDLMARTDHKSGTMPSHDGDHANDFSGIGAVLNEFGMTGY